MEKIRTAVDIIAFATAIIGLSAAYYQYELVKEARVISENTQKKLQSLPEDGKINITNINSAINDLGKITGNTTWTIATGNAGQTVGYVPCYPSDNPNLLAASPKASNADSVPADEGAGALPAQTDIRFTDGTLQVELISLRRDEKGNRLTVTTETRNLTDETIYIGKHNDNDAWFAANSSGQTLNLDRVSGIAYDNSKMMENASIRPGESLTTVWYVRSVGGQFEPGNLSLRGSFVVRSKMKAKNIQVQLKGIRIG